MAEFVRIKNFSFRKSTIDNAYYYKELNRLEIYFCNERDREVIKDVDIDEYNNFFNELNDRNEEVVTENDGEWTPDCIHTGVNNLENMITTLETLYYLKKKYPDDETVSDSVDIMRNEICMLFGGSVSNE